MENLFNSVSRAAEESNMITSRGKEEEKENFGWVCRNVNNLFYLLISTCPDKRMAGIKKLYKTFASVSSCMSLNSWEIDFSCRLRLNTTRVSGESLSKFLLTPQLSSVPLNAKITMFSSIFFFFYPQKDIQWHHNFPCRCSGDVDESRKEKTKMSALK